jgi:RimJ/RimL family protein N-acetyltransferase
LKDLLTGQLVQLAAIDAQEQGAASVELIRDSELMRLMDSEPTRLHSQAATQKFFEREAEKNPIDRPHFAIRTIAGNILLGDVNLMVLNWGSRHAMLGIGILRREYWGKGYGTEAVNLILRFGFTELNLLRVTLTVFEYNLRAMRAYEKAGFLHEGRMRQMVKREGRRWDELVMGILREDWLELQGTPKDAGKDSSRDTGNRRGEQ